MATLLLRRPLPAGGAAPVSPDAEDGARRSLVRRVRGEDPAWVRLGLLAVLALAAGLTLWHLTLNGYSNDYYAAAAKSGSVSWKAWFFGSLDPGSFITVDKPPLSLWLMGLSARFFGFSSFAILLPQALCTIAAVGLLFSTVKRAFGPAAGLAAATALAVTPVTVAIGRVNNPDALLVLLMVAAAALTLKAVESGKTKHLAWVGVLVGLAFMTKMLQGWIVLPALFGTYLLAGPPGLARRCRQLLVATGVTAAVSAAWPVAVTLWPGSTPYIGGSTNGSVWNLILGYNGLGRITGNENGMGGGGPTFGGSSGIWRMFDAEVGGQIAWLLPFAALSLVAGLWLTRKAKRTDTARAGWVLFGLWTLVHVAVFSSAKGIFHPYYTTALAPGVAALAGAGAVVLCKRAASSWVAAGALAAGLAGTACLAVSLLDRAPDYAAWLRWAVPAAALVAIMGVLARRAGGPRQIAAVAAVAGAFALLAGPASWSSANLSRSMSGNNVLAGPAGASGGGFGGGRGGPGGGGGPGGQRGGFPGGGTPPTGAAAGGAAAVGAQAGGGQAGGGQAGGAQAGGGQAGGGARPTGGGGFGGGGVSDEVIAYLRAHQGSAKYLLAASGSQTTAGIIIKTGEPVVTIGGFGGSDPTPTVTELAKLVSSGQLKYVLVGSGGGPGGGGQSGLTSWVRAHGTAVKDVTVSSGTLYAVR